MGRCVSALLLVLLATPASDALLPWSGKQAHRRPRDLRVHRSLLSGGSPPAHKIGEIPDFSGLDLNSTSGNDEALAVLDALQQMSFMGGLKPPGLMDAINTLRCNVCWKRPDILKHKKCMQFLKEICKKGDICGDVCKGFLELLAKACYSDHENAEEACDTYEYITGERPPKPQGEELPDMDGDGIPDEEDDDRDGDGYKNDEDAFPDDEKEWDDTDGDGIGDNSDDDIDGDGHLNDDDACPKDKRGHKDLDGDGICDELDDDRDGDGHKNDEDVYPDDKTKWADTDGDGVADSEDKDVDGDGVVNDDDAFPLDSNETLDTDGDGVGNAADDDADGDSVPDEEDAFPEDPKESKDLDGDGLGDNADTDLDGDGYLNEHDVFTKDKKEWVDSDGDGIGDNSDEDRDGDKANNGEDAFPDDPTRSKAEDGVVDPSKLNKLEKALPSQGYSEHSDVNVEHDDGATQVGDWRNEWPSSKTKTEHDMITKYCKDNPRNTWCDRYAVHGKFAR